MPQLHLMHYLPLTPTGRCRAWSGSGAFTMHAAPSRLVRAARGWLERRRRARRLASSGRPSVVHQARAGLGLPPRGKGAFGACLDSMVAITSTPP